MLVLLVNTNRIVEGLLRNTLQASAHTLRTIAIGDIETLLMPKMEDVEVNDESSSNANEQDTINEIDALLSSGDKGKSKGQKKIIRKLSPPIISADFILFYPPDDTEKAKAANVLLRRAIAFRDVPLLVLTEMSKLITARELITLGADEIQNLPVAPEELLIRIERMSRPVGSRLPVITKLINPYISAVLDMMTTMAGMHVERKDLFLKKNYRLFGDISGVMNFSGRIEGSVTVSFTEDLAKEVIAKIMGITPADISDDDLRDGVGEIINIISGNAKASLAETEFSHEIALPAVVRGAGHHIRHPDGAPCMVVLFEAAGRPFAVLVSMSVKGKTA
ncbi:MAG: chemotaxis protein CheX [Fibrobacteres bacterium]|nr:chemotaxis protein CheX [Fibrobacterota bacterium]